MLDHNVPTVNQMIDFSQEASNYLAQSASNVVAIHCKGGKGRTGTMICVLLIKIGYHDKCSARYNISTISNYHVKDKPWAGKITIFEKQKSSEHTYLVQIAIISLT